MKISSVVECVETVDLILGMFSVDVCVTKPVELSAVVSSLVVVVEGISVVFSASTVVTGGFVEVSVVIETSAVGVMSKAVVDSVVEVTSEGSAVSFLVVIGD